MIGALLIAATMTATHAPTQIERLLATSLRVELQRDTAILDRDKARADLQRCLDTPLPPPEVHGAEVSTVIVWSASAAAVAFLVGALVGGLR